MWKNTALYIIRYRLWILLAMVGLTALMGYYATKVEITFGGNKVLPATDSSIVKYNRFTQTFGEDGSVMDSGNCVKVCVANQFA